MSSSAALPATVSDQPEVDAERRFGGIDRLYGAGAIDAQHAAPAGGIGVGGVGSWAVEALARQAVDDVAGLVADPLLVDLRVVPGQPTHHLATAVVDPDRRPARGRPA